MLSKFTVTILNSFFRPPPSNNNINGKVSGAFKFQGLNSGAGWYRFAKLKNESNGASGSSVLFFIKTYFNNTPNMSVTGLLNTAYGTSSIKILGNSVYSYVVSSVRHVVDKSNNCSYLEFYYNVSEPNGISIDLIASRASDDKEWKFLEQLEKTDESVSNVEVYSTVNLKTKENYVVTNSDFDKYNLNYHAREIIRSGTINDFIANKINGGYFGGDIIMTGDFIPSDTFKGYEWGLIHWKKSGSNIAFLTYYPDRSTEIGYKSISPSENYDTGWITK